MEWKGSETTSLYPKCDTQSVVFLKNVILETVRSVRGPSTETPICDTTPAANFNTDLFTKLKPEPNYIAERLTNTDGARTAQLVPETGSPLALSLTNAGTDGPLDVVFDTVNRVAVWSQLEYRASDFDVTGEETEAYAAIVGGDYLVRDNLLVGALLAVDRSEVETSGATNEAETDGYMVGPYFAYLTSNGFVLAGRALYGTSETDVVLATSSDTGSYDTERSFYGLSLSSPQFVTGNTSVSYGAEVYYVDYSSDAYTATGQRPTAAPGPVPHGARPERRGAVPAGHRLRAFHQRRAELHRR